MPTSRSVSAMDSTDVPSTASPISPAVSRRETTAIMAKLMARTRCRSAEATSRARRRPDGAAGGMAVMRRPGGRVRRIAAGQAAGGARHGGKAGRGSEAWRSGVARRSTTRGCGLGAGAALTLVRRITRAGGTIPAGSAGRGVAGGGAGAGPGGLDGFAGRPGSGARAAAATRRRAGRGEVERRGQAVGGIDGAVVRGVGGGEGGPHGDGIVEVGQRGAGMRGAGVEDGLGGALDGGALGGGGVGPGEGVVDYAFRAAEIAFQPAACYAN